MLNQWVMSQHLPDISNDPNLIALHEKLIKKGVKAFYKTIKQVVSHICTYCH